MKLFARFRGYLWDRTLGRFISRWTGKPILESTIKRAGSKYVANSIIPNIKALSQAYFDGKMDISDLQKKIMEQYKTAWTVQAALGKGGKNMMTQSDWGHIGWMIRQENSHFYDLMLELQSGTISQAQFEQRLEYYAQASEIGYWDMKALVAAEAGYTEERRILSGNDNCDDCIDYADMEWQPLDSLPAPKTECQCGRNCNCIKEYR